MARTRYTDLTVEGVRSQRGHSMVKISDPQTTHYLLASHLIGNFKGAMADLANAGIVAFDGQQAGIRSRLSGLTYEGGDVVYDSPGWNHPVFVDGGKRVFKPKEAVEGHAVFQAPVDRFRSSGTLAAWLDGVAGPLTGQPVAECLLGLMFAGVLTSLTGYNINPGFMVVGKAEDGKSFLLSLAGSVCGPPGSDNTGDGYPLSFSGTNNGIESEMQNYSDMTMIFDDAAAYGYSLSTKERGRAATGLIMNLADGREKMRYATQARHFRFCYVTSSNDDLDVILAGAGSSSILEAIKSRLITINLQGRPYGVLDALEPGYTDKADFLIKLLDVARLNHGVAMPHFLSQAVELVSRDREKFRKRLLEHISTFRGAATRGAPRQASRRVVDAFGLIYASIRLAQRFGALPAGFSPLASTLACYHLHLDSSLPAARPVEVLGALLDDPEVRTLRRGERIGISKRRFAAAKAFKVVSSRHTEIIMSPEAAERLFGRWKRVCKHDPDIKVLLIREPSRPTTYRRLRKASRDRVVCFQIPPDWPFARASKS